MTQWYLSLDMNMVYFLVPEVPRLFLLNKRRSPPIRSFFIIIALQGSSVNVYKHEPVYLICTDSS